MRERLTLVERQEAEDNLRLKAMRESAGRFRTPDGVDTLQERLSVPSQEPLADLLSRGAAGL